MPSALCVNISDFHDLLTPGTNLLVVANWNITLDSSDLAAGVQLILKPTSSCILSDCSDYADWVAWGKPVCWCYPRQCRGDSDGLKVGPYWVQMLDLNALVAAFNKTDSVLETIPNGICSDFDHMKVGPYRVQMLDLNIFTVYFNKIETLVPICDICEEP